MGKLFKETKKNALPSGSIIIIFQYGNVQTSKNNKL